jgi:hypothetical protein
MGQSGMTLGLALYDNAASIKQLLNGQIAPQQHTERVSSLSLMFEEEFNLAAADLDAADQFGWPVATPEAYPWVIRVRPGRAIGAPSASEVDLLEACLRALPNFIDENRRQGEAVVTTAQGEQKLSLELCPIGL